MLGMPYLLFAGFGLMVYRGLKASQNKAAASSGAEAPLAGQGAPAAAPAREESLS